MPKQRPYNKSFDTTTSLSMIKTTKKAVEYQKKVLSQINNQTIKEKEQKNIKLFKPRINANSSKIVLNKKAVSPPIIRARTSDERTINDEDDRGGPIDTWRGAFDHLQSDLIMRVEKKRSLE